MSFISKVVIVLEHCQHYTVSEQFNPAIITNPPTNNRKMKITLKTLQRETFDIDIDEELKVQSTPELHVHCHLCHLCRFAS